MKEDMPFDIDENGDKVQRECKMCHELYYPFYYEEWCMNCDDFLHTEKQIMKRMDQHSKRYKRALERQAKK